MARWTRCAISGEPQGSWAARVMINGNTAHLYTPQLLTLPPKWLRTGSVTMTEGLQAVLSVSPDRGESLDLKNTSKYTNAP